MFKDFVDSCIEHIDSFWEAMLQYVDPIAGVLGGICGLATFLYIGSKVWSSYSRGESIEIYPLLRPFIIGLLCTQFNTVVIGGIRGLADPICEYFKGIETQSRSDVNVTASYTKALEDAQRKAAKLQEVLDEKQVKEDGLMSRIGREIQGFFQKVKNQIFLWLAQLFGFIAELLAFLTKFVLLFTRCFSLSVLCVLGPIIFVSSIFPSFKQGIVQWIARFVCIYFWIPLFYLCDIFINTVKNGIGYQLVDNIHRMINTIDLSSPDPSAVADVALQLQGVSANIAILGALISILTASLYKSVPTLASWILAGGDASGNLASIGNFANTTAAMAGAGAAAVVGLSTRVGGRALRSGGAAAGGMAIKAGQKVLDGGSGASQGGAQNSMGTGPRTASASRPIGFRSSAATAAESDASGESAPSLRFSEPLAQGTVSTTAADAIEHRHGSTFGQVSRQAAGKALIGVGKFLRRPQENHIMRYGTARQKYLLAQDPYASRSVLKKAIDSDNPFIQQAAIKNENISPKLLKRAAKYGYEETSNEAAARLRELGKKAPTPAVRNLPASVFNQPIPISQRGGDPPSAVAVPTQTTQNQTPIGFQQSQPTSTTEKTAEKTGVVRRTVGKSLIGLGKVLRRPQENHIMRYGTARQKYLLAQDPYASRSVLKKAIDSDNPFIQQAAIKNTNTSLKLLRRAVKYGYEETSNEAAARLRELGKTMPKRGAHLSAASYHINFFEPKQGAKR